MILQVLLDMPKTKHRMVLQKDLLKKTARFSSDMLKHQPTDHQLSNLYQVPWLPGYPFDHVFEKDAASSPLTMMLKKALKITPRLMR